MLGKSQNDLANPTANMQTIPSGSFVIPMDSLNYYGTSPQLFNLNTYGLIFTLLNNQIGIHWFITAGKAKDGIDFSANIQQILPISGSTATKNLRAGPMIIYPRDTTGVRAIINTFNSLVASSSTGQTKTKVNVYRTTSTVVADLRYILTQIPSVAALNDGGYGSVQTGYFVNANIPSSNYKSIPGHTLLTGCYTIATQPHNATALAQNLDSILAFLNQGGNFFAQCEGVLTYENFGTTPGFFQTTEGLSLDNNNTSITYPNADVGYNQFLGSFDATNVGGYLQTWYMTPASGSTPASVYKYNGYTTVSNGTPTTGAPSKKHEHISASAAKIKSNTSAGSMMFYAGGHDYGSSTGTDFTNGMRLYFNAVLTPCGTRNTCNNLFFDIDMGVSQVVSATRCYNDTVTLTTTVKNNGPSILASNGVVVTDTLPTGFTFISYSATKGTYSNGTGKWTLPVMYNGDSAVLTIKALALTSSTKKTTASVSATSYDQNAANDTSSVYISAYPLPTASTIANSSICIGNSISIGATAVSGHTYSWTSSPAGYTSTFSNPTVSPVVTTIYTLTETNSTTGCKKSNLVTITVNPLPLAAVIANTSICSGSSISIGSTTVSGSTYSWTSSPIGFSSTLSNPSVSPTTTTAYTLTETNSNGCIKSNSVTITVNTLPTASVASNSSICAGASFSIGATSISGSTYSWSSSPLGFSSTSSNPFVSPAVTTTYTLTETNSFSCIKSNSVTITVKTLPNASVIANTGICIGSSISIGNSSVSGSIYSWASSPAGFSSTISNPSVSPSATTTYTLTETGTNGCANAHSVIITINSLPAASVAPNASVCSGSSNLIGAASVAGSTYSWVSVPASFTSTSSNPSVNPTSTKTYTLTETNAAGCIQSNSVTLTVLPLPAAIAGSNTSICIGSSTSIGGSAVAGSVYSWVSSPAGFSSTSSNPTISPSISTFYTLTETGSNGCTKSNSVTITVNPLPAAAVIANTSICSGSSVSIGALAVSGSTYSWSSTPGGYSSTLSNPSVSPLFLTTYTLTETNSNGCANSNSVIIYVNPSPSPFITGDSIPCGLTKMDQYFTSPSALYSYIWSISNGTLISGQGTNSVYINWGASGPGSVTLTETNTATGCSKSTTYNVMVYSKPGGKLIYHY